MEWKENPMGNVYAYLESGAYLSYNPRPLIFGSQGAETALVVKTADGDKKFLILLGDWRKKYEEAFADGGLEACMKLFIDNQKTHESDWSTGEITAEKASRLIDNILGRPTCSTTNVVTVDEKDCCERPWCERCECHHNGRHIPYLTEGWCYLHDEYHGPDKYQEQS